MILTIEIKPEIEASLAQHPAAIGVGVRTYAANLLEEAANVPSAAAKSAAAKDMVEPFAPLRGLNLEFERDANPKAAIATSKKTCQVVDQ